MGNEQKLKSYNLLVKVGRNITSSFNSDAILDYILREVTKVFPPVNAGVLYLYDEEKKVLCLQSCAGFQNEVLLYQIPPGIAISGKTFERRQPVIINSADELETYVGPTDIPLSRFERSRDSTESPKTVMSACLITHNQIIGVTTVDSYSLDQKFSPEDLELLEAAVDYAAITISQFNMIKKEKHYILELQNRKRDLERMLLIQNNLIDIIVRGIGFSGIPDYLGKVISSPVVLYNILLESVAYSSKGVDCPLPSSFFHFSRYNEFVKNKFQSTMDYKDEGGTYFISPAIGKNKLLGFLIVFTNTDELDESEKLAFSYTSLVVVQEWLKQDELFEVSQKTKGDVFHGALPGVIDRSLILHAGKLGLDYWDYFDVIIVKEDLSSCTNLLEQTARSNKLVKDIISLSGKWGINGTVVPERNSTHVMVSFSKSVFTRQQQIVEAGQEVLRLDKNIQITVGQLYENLLNLFKSYRETRECFEIVEKYPTSPKIINYEQLGILYLILKLSGDELSSYIDKVLQPLLEYDAQKNAGPINTLQVYIDSNKNIKYVVEYLNVCYNTACWRVRKTERFLQQDSGSTQDWLNIQAACMLYGIIHKNFDY